MEIEDDPEFGEEGHDKEIQKAIIASLNENKNKNNNDYDLEEILKRSLIER